MSTVKDGHQLLGSMIQIGNTIVKRIDRRQARRSERGTKWCKCLGKGHRTLAIFLMLMLVIFLGGFVLNQMVNPNTRHRHAHTNSFDTF